MNFTIIFLTKGRTEIYKSLSSVFKITEYQINLKLIIIDGNDDNRVEDIINEKFSKYKNYVKIFKQKNKGFMSGCFEATNLVDTKFFTFMYDDDELSPYYGELVREALISNQIFYSYGKVSSFSSTFKFLKPSLNYEPANQILSNYFSLNFGKRLIPPNSPICSIFKTEILKDWKKILLDYCQKDKHFYFYLLEKNIGPDLLLYLLSLHNEENNIRSLDEANKCDELWNIKNGRTLCKKCHEQTETYGGSSKKKRI